MQVHKPHFEAEVKMATPKTFLTDIAANISGDSSIRPEDVIPIIENYSENGSVIRCYPGSGKTRDAIEMANWLWEKHGIRTLYLMLSHSAINEVVERNNLDWTHWRGHQDGCEKRKYAQLGYSTKDCTCGMDVDRSRPGPAIAPVEYILPDNPDWFTREIFNFQLWIIDEVDLKRYVANKTITQDELSRASHGQQVVADVIDALSKSFTGKLSGTELYDEVSKHLEEAGTSLATVMDELLDIKVQDLTLDQSKPIPNFPKQLMSIFGYEAENYLNSRSFNSRIHIDAQAGELRYWWNKTPFPEELIEPAVPGYPDSALHAHPAAIILDASADQTLMRQVTPYVHEYQVEEPEWPAHVHVHQYLEASVSRSTLSLYPAWKTNTKDALNTRRVWYDRVVKGVKALPGYSPDWAVGLITFKDIANEAVEYIRTQGIKVLDPIHYHNQRGSNELEDVKVLVMLGSPYPSPEGFYEEAQAFFGAFESLTSHTTQYTQQVFMKDGSVREVSIHGYEDSNVNRYHRQKTVYEMYQGVHRIRPHNVDAGDERHVLLFSNVPIPGVIVESQLMSDKAKKSESRMSLAINVINEAVGVSGECTKAELSEALASDELKRDSADKWIQRNRKKLAEATGTKFYGGKGAAAKFRT